MESAANGAHTFLVEHYRPSVSAEVFRAALGRQPFVAEEIAGAGAPRKLLHSTFVPEDEWRPASSTPLVNSWRRPTTDGPGSLSAASCPSSGFTTAHPPSPRHKKK